MGSIDSPENDCYLVPIRNMERDWPKGLEKKPYRSLRRPVIGRYIGLHNCCTPRLSAGLPAARRVRSYHNYCVLKTLQAGGFAAADRMAVIIPGSFLSACRVLSGRWYFLDSRFSESYKSIECTLEVLQLV